METTERIVNSYCNYIKGWATIPNIKCDKGQQEIDILAIDPNGKDEKSRYHIECSISLSSMGRITGKQFSPEKLKQRIYMPQQRMTIGHFIERKFGARQVIDKLAEYGFKSGNYTRVIAAMGFTEEAKRIAKKEEIELWNFGETLEALADELKTSTKYYEDDTMRTIQSFLKWQEKQGKRRGRLTD